MADRMFASFDPSLISGAVEALADGVVLLDPQGRVQYANRAFEEGIELPREDLVGKRFDDPVFEMCHLDGTPVESSATPFWRVLESGEAALGEEYDLVSVTGRLHRVVINVVPVRHDGEMVGAAVTLRDITRRARAEEALRESEERLQAFVDQARYGLVISSIEGKVVLYNPAMEKLTGHTFEEVREKGWPEAAYPDPADRAHAMEMAGKSVRGEVSYNEEPYTRADGEQIWLSYAVSPVRLKGREYIAAIIIDVTERKRAEERVRFQSSLLDQVHNAVVSSDLDGKITYMNDAAEQLYGWDAETATGRLVQDVVLAASVNPEAMLRQVVETGKWQGESLMRRANGEEVPVMLTLALLHDAAGTPEGVVGVASDITEIKAAQRQLEEKDRAIRRAYVDVVGAVTGGKLVLMTPEELGPILGEPMLGKNAIRFDTLAESRHRVREVMEREGLATEPSEAIIAYGEAATNALKHAGGGRYAVFRKDRVLQVLVADDGPGIDFRLLPRATLTPGFSTKSTLGIGFTVMLELSDRMLLTTQPGCTEVLLEFALR